MPSIFNGTEPFLIDFKKYKPVVLETATASGQWRFKKPENRFKLNRIEFYVTIGTSGDPPSYFVSKERPWNKPPEKPKRRPKHQFLSDSDIENLLDKYFNGKENSL